MISRRIWNQLTRRKKPFSQPTKSLYRQKRGLRFEPLEMRQMLSVSLGTLPNIQVPGGKTVLVPLTGADSDGEAITYSFQSSDSNVTLSLVSPGGHNLALTVSGTDGAGNPFNGTMVIHLFDDLAPNTSARIEQLVTSGFYNGLPFTRVLDGFVAQGGDNGTGGTGQLIDDEFNPSLTFNSPGLLAMANRGDDTSDSQFFITAIDGAGSTNPIALANMPQFLNFNYSIFGQLVSGFDTFEKIMSTQVQLNNQTGETSQPVNPITITAAQLIDDNHDGVLSVFAPASFDGSSATITVTATNSDGLSTQQQFTAAAVTDTQVDPPFLGPITNQVTTTGTPDVFTLTSDRFGRRGRHLFCGRSQHRRYARQRHDHDRSGQRPGNRQPDAGFLRHHQFAGGGTRGFGEQRHFEFRYPVVHRHGASTADTWPGDGLNHQLRHANRFDVNLDRYTWRGCGICNWNDRQSGRRFGKYRSAVG